MDCNHIKKKKRGRAKISKWPGDQSLNRVWLPSNMCRSGIGIQLGINAIEVCGKEEPGRNPGVVVKGCWVASGQFPELLASLFSALVCFLKFSNNFFFFSLFLYLLPSFSRYLLSTIIDTIDTAVSKTWNFMQVWGQMLSK